MDIQNDLHNELLEQGHLLIKECESEALPDNETFTILPIDKLENNLFLPIDE